MKDLEAQNGHAKDDLDPSGRSLSRGRSLSSAGVLSSGMPVTFKV
jgi:hypothetical protein